MSGNLPTKPCPAQKRDRGKCDAKPPLRLNPGDIDAQPSHTHTHTERERERGRDSARAGGASLWPTAPAKERKRERLVFLRMDSHLEGIGSP